jgi:glycosyltransferase involved in cell wall biosynthesis
VNSPVPRRSRVLIVHHSGLLGGAGRSLIDLVDGLSQTFDLVVMTPSMPSELASELDRLGIEHEAFPGRMAKIPHYSGGEPVWHPRFWFYVLAIVFQWRHWSQVIRSQSIDVLVVNSSVIAWLGALPGRHKRVLMVRETRRGSAKSFWNRIHNYLRRRFDRVAYLTEFDRAQDGLDRDRTVVCPDAVRVDDFVQSRSREAALSELGLAGDRQYVAYVGGSNRLKGLHVAVEALGRCGQPNLALIAAGRPPREFRSIVEIVRGAATARGRFDLRVRRTIRRHGLADRVHFIGVRSDIPRVFDAAESLVFPMTEPHQARPAFEIGLQRKPVIISDFPQIAECVVHMKNGLVFPAGDAETLGCHLARLHSDPGLAAELGIQNFNHAVAVHESTGVFRRLADEIAQLNRCGEVV